MCFAPQRHALFRHLNFQKWSEHGVFCTFWLGNVLRATTACTFLTSTSKSGPNMVCFVRFDLEMCFAPQRRALFRHQLPKVVRTWCVLHIVTSKCASRHNGVQFSSLIWPAGLASLLLDPPETQIIGKTQCFATFLPFRAPASSFFWLFLFFDLLSSAVLFSILLLHLCFSSVHIIGSLTSKLPSISSCNVLQLN